MKDLEGEGKGGLGERAACLGKVRVLVQLEEKCVARDEAEDGAGAGCGRASYAMPRAARFILKSPGNIPTGLKGNQMQQNSLLSTVSSVLGDEVVGIT